MTDSKPGVEVRLIPRHQHRCMHCLRDITQQPTGRWADSDGIDVCIVRSYQGRKLAPVYHTPLPLI